MIYQIQQFQATRYVTVAEAATLDSAFTAAGQIKARSPELPVRIQSAGVETYITNHRKENRIG